MQYQSIVETIKSHSDAGLSLTAGIRASWANYFAARLGHRLSR